MNENSNRIIIFARYNKVYNLSTESYKIVSLIKKIEEFDLNEILIHLSYMIFFFDYNRIFKLVRHED